MQGAVTQSCVRAAVACGVGGAVFFKGGAGAGVRTCPRAERLDPSCSAKTLEKFKSSREDELPLNRFISKSAKQSFPLFQSFKGSKDDFVWGTPQQEN